MSSPAGTTDLLPERLHADGIAALEAGDALTAVDLLTQAARLTADLTPLNDLAVIYAAAGDVDRARALWTTCLTLDDDNADALANLAELDQPSEPDTVSWRTSPTLGGTDERVPERAYPGMALFGTMSEHAMRYSLALGLLRGKHFLDVGCGTGYGSEMLTWRARHRPRLRPLGARRARAPALVRRSRAHVWLRRLQASRCPPPTPLSMFEVLEHLRRCPGGAAQRLWRGQHADRVVPEPGPPRFAPESRTT